MKLEYLWTHKEPEEFKKTIYNHSNNPVLVKLKSIVRYYLEQAMARQLRRPEFDSSGFIYSQIDTNAEVRTLLHMTDLLNFVEDKK